MARTRNIKPGFFRNEELCSMPPLTRLLFAGLWVHADREGRLEDRPKRLKADIFPFEELSLSEFEESLNNLATEGFIIRYEDSGKRCIQVVNWHKHQNPHHMEIASELPPPLGVSDRIKADPIRREQRERILSRDGHKCVLCGSDQELQIDHIKERINGGSSDDENLRVLCSKCNNSRTKPSLRGNRDLLASSSRVVDNSSTTRAQSVDESCTSRSNDTSPYSYSHPITLTCTNNSHPPSSAEVPEPERNNEEGVRGGFSNENKNVSPGDKPVDIGKEKFPLTAAAIERHFPGYGALMADQTVYACQMVDKEVTDQQVADGVRLSHFPKQGSPGAFKTTVPRLVKEWMLEREKEKAKVSKPKPKWSNNIDDYEQRPRREPVIPSPPPSKSGPVMEMGRHKTGQLHSWLESMRDKRA